MTLTLFITPAAQEDLTDIYRYSLTNWGALQAEAYLTQLEEKLWLLTEQPAMGKQRNDLFQGLRSLAVNKHLVYYRQESSHIQIARILHERQDPERHKLPT